MFVSIPKIYYENKLAKRNLILLKYIEKALSSTVFWKEGAG